MPCCLSPANEIHFFCYTVVAFRLVLSQEKPRAQKLINSNTHIKALLCIVQRELTQQQLSRNKNLQSCCFMTSVRLFIQCRLNCRLCILYTEQVAWRGAGGGQRWPGGGVEPTPLHLAGAAGCPAREERTQGSSVCAPGRADVLQKVGLLLE